MISCLGDFQEKKLLDYSDENGKFKFEVIERDFNENDSLNFEEKRFVVLDSQHRIINKNNLQFFFYNNQNKLQEIKSVYRRGGKTNILINKYLYNDKGNLIYITYRFNNKIDTVRKFKYNSFNQLVEEFYLIKSLSVKYKYDNNKISEKKEFEKGGISENFKFSYDSKGNKSIQNRTFNGDQKLRTYFKYNSENRLINKRDSSLTTFGNPNEYVEFIDEYYYDKTDSLIERRQLGRVLNDKEFKLRGKTTYEYKKL
jgi:hypothetical protein